MINAIGIAKLVCTVATLGNGTQEVNPDSYSHALKNDVLTCYVERRGRVTLALSLSLRNRGEISRAAPGAPSEGCPQL
jgi:hypothetical protein